MRTENSYLLPDDLRPHEEDFPMILHNNEE